MGKKSLREGRFYGYLIIELRTGVMDGIYSDFVTAEHALAGMQELYPKGNFSIFLGITHPGNFDGKFPPDHLFHVHSSLTNFIEKKDCAA